MIVPQYKNSAGRLLAILSNIDQGKPIETYLPDLIFSLEAQCRGRQRTEKCIDAMNGIHQIYHQFQKDLETAQFKNDEQRKVILKRLEKIEEVIYTPAATGAVRPLSEGEIASLEFCATTFEEEGEFAPSDIEAIWNDIHELQQEVENGNIPLTLKKHSRR
jgi:hypothetical protein